MNALLLTRDLMFSSQLTGAAMQVGARLTTIGEVEAVVRHAAEQPGVLVFLDLATPGIDVASTVAQLREQAPRAGAIIAFGPHVHAERLAAAREAGCDEVLSRGGLHRQMREIFLRHAEG